MTRRSNLRREASVLTLGIVVTTLGRVERLRRLLDSLVGQLTRDDRVIVVAQRNIVEVRSLVREYPSLPITVTTSGPGAANGRNVGVGELPLDDRTLLFPNDSTWYPDGAIAKIRVATSAPDFCMGAMAVIDEYGPKLQIPDPEPR